MIHHDLHPHLKNCVEDLLTLHITIIPISPLSKKVVATLYRGALSLNSDMVDEKMERNTELFDPLADAKGLGWHWTSSSSRTLTPNIQRETAAWFRSKYVHE